jgi:hypothetical protein
LVAQYLFLQLAAVQVLWRQIKMVPVVAKVEAHIFLVALLEVETQVVILQ